MTSYSTVVCHTFPQTTLQPKNIDFFFFFFFHVLSRKIGQISLKCSENYYKYFVISDFYAEKFVICGYFLTHRGIGTPGELQKTCYKQKFVISEFVISGLDCNTVFFSPPREGARYNRVRALFGPILCPLTLMTYSVQPIFPLGLRIL